jgi:hypothetical protein
VRTVTYVVDSNPSVLEPCIFKRRTRILYQRATAISSSPGAGSRPPSRVEHIRLEGIVSVGTARWSRGTGDAEQCREILNVVSLKFRNGL